MNIYENIAFPLEVRKMPREEIEKRVTDVARMVGVEGCSSADRSRSAAAKRSASPWRAPWSATRMFFLWMSHSATWMPS